MLDQSLLFHYVTDAESQKAIAEAADIPTTYARNGRPTLVWNGTRLHSGVNPDVEFSRDFPELEQLDISKVSGQRSIQCILLGGGLGYAIKALDRKLRSLFPQCELSITCLEHEPAIARKALQLRLWEPVQANVRFCLAQAFNQDTSLAAGTIVIRSTPGFRQFAANYEQAIHTTKAEPTVTRDLKILVPTPLYGGSLPIASYCARAFGELGCHVEVLDLSPYHGLLQHASAVTTHRERGAALQNILVSFLSQLIVTRAVEMQADLVWAVAQTPLSVAALKELRQQHIATALWFVEDWETLNYWQHVATSYDHVFTIQRGPFHEALKQLGTQSVHYLPLAADPATHKPMTLSAEERAMYGSETAFVGAGYQNRQHVFEQARLGDFVIWGNDWPAQSSAYRQFARRPGARVTPEECARIYNACAVNINLHSSSKHNGVNPHGDFVNPRTFEIAACGGFQLVDDRAELADLFAIGSELIVYKTVQELEQLTQYYLQHPEERSAVAARAQARACSDHTYAKRMHTALQAMGWSQRPSRPADSHNSVASLIDAAGGDHELIEFLQQFPAEATMTVDDFARHIYSGSGDLSRAEALFLMMKEFRDWGRERGVIA